MMEYLIVTWLGGAIPLSAFMVWQDSMFAEDARTPIPAVILFSVLWPLLLLAGIWLWITDDL